MSFLSALLILAATIGCLVYQRRALWLSSICLLFTWFILKQVHLMSNTTYVLGWCLLIPLTIIFNTPIRRYLLTAPIFKIYRKFVPKLSDTEQEALNAGNKSWETELFNGKPNWASMMKLEIQPLSSEEQAFLNGPTQTLCNLTQDWEVNHQTLDLSQEIWDYIKQERFFSLIIPKEYGGREFSAQAHSQIIAKLAGASMTLATTVAVPNSLGPAELLLHFGTDEQKNHYLPRLANGTDIPCFALTSPQAGSDAASIPDEGIVCYEQYQGKKTLGLKLNFDKRYITLAPVATVIGLAFQAKDPDKILGKQQDYGITCALLNPDLPGLEVGKRHLPLNLAFQNGPVRGKNVFIPMDCIIGGQAMLGKGWQMLMSCLAAGRGISLPAATSGGAELCLVATANYTRIRKQFNLPIAEFEGIQEPLARMAASVYEMKAARCITNSIIDSGVKPALISAIMKSHVTENAQSVGKYAMDCHGGKGICIGPNNYLASGYLASPIAITVEGANILTRNMIIYGQGAMRSHPYIIKEIEACLLTNKKQALKLFDREFWSHAGFILSNGLRTVCLGMSFKLLGRYSNAPKKYQHYFHSITRFSSAFAFISDLTMISLGSQLKKKESISARLGDILSYLYLSTCTLKYFLAHPEEKQNEPLLRYVIENNFYKIQARFLEIMQNFPSRWVGKCLKYMTFPCGASFQPPCDTLTQSIAQSLTTHSAMRTFFTEPLCIDNPNSTHPARELITAFDATLTIAPIEEKIKQAYKIGKIKAKQFNKQIIEAQNNNIITRDEYELIIATLKIQASIIAVDEFTSSQLTILKKHLQKQHANQPALNNE